MRFISTRDNTVKVSAAQAIAQGISKESGLFVPETFPKISMETLEEMKNRSYQERAYSILKEFLPEFSQQELEQAIASAYGTNFQDKRIAPVKRLSDTEYLLELWHGPTCAFKDMALQLLPHLLTLSLEKVAEGKKAVILVATSGDTGKAALEGFQDVAGTEMVVFYPEGGVSEVQRLQMTTQAGENLHVFSVEGNFDDTQTGVKELFTDVALGKKLEENGLMFSSANSINWGRLMPQIVYYFSAYLDMVVSSEIIMGDLVNVCVPTGNFGNILAAFYAKQMGLPLGKFICASNENHVLTDFFETGTYNANRRFILTSSPSMDILISSNLERLLFELEDREDTAVRAMMDSLSETGKYKVSAAAKEKMDQEFFGGYATEEETTETIASLFAAYDYLCDTHTAVAVSVCRDYQEKTGDTAKTIIASTANPYKFAPSILEAIYPSAVPEDEFETLETLNDISGLPIPKQIAELKNKKERFDTVIKIDEMEETVRRVLEI